MLDDRTKSEGVKRFVWEQEDLLNRTFSRVLKETEGMDAEKMCIFYRCVVNLARKDVGFMIKALESAFEHQEKRTIKKLEEMVN